MTPQAFIMIVGIFIGAASLLILGKALAGGFDDAIAEQSTARTPVLHRLGNVVGAAITAFDVLLLHERVLIAVITCTVIIIATR